jgi:hypothetical protein
MDKGIKWTKQQEQLLVQWAEKASGYAWLHTRCVNYFRHRNLYISIPASIFGYIAGATTLLANPVITPTIKGLIGISGIAAGLLTNFQEMFTFKEESEKHKISSLRYLSFFREISCELSMAQSHRSTPGDFINMKRLEFDKMLEQSPTIPQSIADLFNTKFSHLSFHKPDLVNGVQTIYPYKDNSPKIFYLKKLNLYEKMLLLKYFSAWGTYCEERRVVKKNNILIKVANASARMKEQRKAFSHLHGPLRLQRKLLQFQNVKIGINEDNIPGGASPPINL